MFGAWAGGRRKLNYYISDWIIILATNDCDVGIKNRIVSLKKLKKCLKIILFVENFNYFLKLINILFEIQKNNLIKFKFYKSTLNINEYMEIYVDFKVNWLKNNLLSEYHLINMIFLFN